MEELKAKYSIGEACEMLNISRSALVRLCNSGLIRHIRRDQRYRRILNEEQINLARTLLGLRQAGFKNGDIRRYSKLFYQGSSALSELKALVDTRRRQLWQNLESIQASIDFLERQSELIDQEMSK